MSKTRPNRYNIGLQVWQGTWLHYLISKHDMRLNREWFFNADSSVATCDCEGERETMLDHVLNSDSKIETKYYNAVLCLAMGCNTFIDVDETSLQLLAAAANAVYETEIFAQEMLGELFPKDLVQLISIYYANNWSENVHDRDDIVQGNL